MISKARQPVVFDKTSMIQIGISLDLRIALSIMAIFQAKNEVKNTAIKLKYVS